MAIEIQDKDGFQQSINSLRTLQSELPGKVSAGSKLIDALKTAASAGVVGSSSGVAPVYVNVLAAVNDAMTNIQTQVTAAGSSVDNTLTNLQSILDTQTSIQDEAAKNVENI